MSTNFYVLDALANTKWGSNTSSIRQHTITSVEPPPQ